MAMRGRKEVQDKFLDLDASMSGTLTFKDAVNLRINGKFEGTLEAKGNLRIGPQAVVNAHIVGEDISIAGKVKGDIIAKVRLTFESTAEVQGEIKAARFCVIEGAVFEGECRMLEDIFSPDELARYLEVDINSIVEWANSGKLPAFKEGSSWRFERKKIDEWIASEKVR